MLASQDKEIEQAASSMWQLTEDRKVREQIRRREANINAYNRKEKMLADLKEQLKKKDYQLKEKDDMLEIQGKKLEEKDRLIDELRKKLDKIEA